MTRFTAMKLSRVIFQTIKLSTVKICKGAATRPSAKIDRPHQAPLHTLFFLPREGIV